MTAPEIHKPDGHIPDGTIIGVRGPHSVFAPDTQLNRWFKSAYEKRYGTAPLFLAYHMVQAILGTKAVHAVATTPAQRLRLFFAHAPQSCQPSP